MRSRLGAEMGSERGATGFSFEGGGRRGVVERGFMFEFGHLRGRAGAGDAYRDFLQLGMVFVESWVPWVFQSEELGEFVVLDCFFAGDMYTMQPGLSKRGTFLMQGRMIPTNR